jgi:hypothetical protein
MVYMTILGERLPLTDPFSQYRPIIWAHYWHEGFNERIAECKQIVATAKKKPITSPLINPHTVKDIA